MLFRTILEIAPSTQQIHHANDILLIGSCFSDNIGQRLQKYKFRTTVNPFGTIYNPASITKLITYAITNTRIDINQLIDCNQYFAHLDFSYKFNHHDPKKMIDLINQVVADIHNHLINTDYIFITYGTAYVYHYNQTNEIVANCHKINPLQFTKKMMSVDDCYYSMSELNDILLSINPNIKVVFTVSPVRHIKDGMIENNISKSTLLLAIHKVCNTYQMSSYFPVYEWVIDDLRDYRFYEKDNIHPNALAIDYVWEKFQSHYFKPETVQLNKEIESINRFLQHKPFNSNSPDYLKQILKIHQGILNIQNINFPNKSIQIDFSQELSNIETLLASM